jgi:MoaA/NifB/PqqE/SkfB family radical SAM enzyme
VAACAQERLVVVWRVTTHCNLSCGFCAYDRRLPLARHDVAEAQALVLGAALARERERSQREVHVSFLGGEPFAWQPLPRVARELAASGLTLGITTNGSQLSAVWARELLLDCFAEVTLSIDGLADVHDRLRGWSGGFERLVVSLRQLAEAKKLRGRGPLLRVNTVLMRDNLEQFPELCRTLASLGIEELTFNRLGGRDRPDFYAAHRLSAAALEHFAEQLPSLRSELLTRGLRLQGASLYVERLLSLERAEPLSVPSCEPGRRFLFLDEHGMQAPCSFTLDSYGEPASASADGLAELAGRFSLRQLSERATACNDCQSTQVAGKFRGA